MVQVVKLPRFRKDSRKLDFQRYFKQKLVIFDPKWLLLTGNRCLKPKSTIFEPESAIFEPKSAIFEPKSVIFERDPKFLTKSSDFRIEICYF